ncbi:MAG: ABC transporter permease [Rhodocyclaceae bacterium]|nr:ABC transporter permease [Rhodocyclaceae bacterium]
MSFFLREAWHEFRAGIKGGVLPLIYVVLTGYILLVMTSADNLRSMGAVDIPRNAPGLVYLMTSGDAFFLFFAWAWVFAQPIVRDRSAQLHEIVLAAPLSLRQLLAARYVGALGVALLLGTSQIVGFLAAPLLEAVGAVPPGSVAAAPWAAFGWAFLIFTLPLAAGAGALYFIAALRSRSVGGAFAVAAALMAFWMVAMIVFKEGHADPFLVTVLDPSGFAEAEHQVVDQWTPHEKSTALLALTPALQLNRLLWGLLPIALLALFVARTTRESLLHGRGEKSEKSPAAPAAGGGKQTAASGATLPGPIAGSSWLRAAAAEARWQARQILNRRSLWVALALLVLLAVAAAFVHGIQHAYGPMVARAEYIAPVLSRTFYLIVVFMVAAMVGMAARRDEQPGLSEMFDAAPAPNSVRLAGRSVAALVVGVVCVSIPALGTVLAGLLTTPHGTVLQPVVHLMTVLLPAILEMAAITLLLHALIRHPGTAHAAAILVAFIMVVNFEVGLVTYPPYQIGKGAGIAVSGLTGFAPWSEKLLASDLFKLSLIAVLVALAAIVVRRGTDEGWRPRLRQWRRGLFGAPGLAAVAGVVALVGCAAWLHQRYVTEGGYETREQELAGDAAWEERWLPRQGEYSVDGGEVLLTVRPAGRELEGRWRLEGVRVYGPELHAALPNGFALLAAQVDGQPVEATVDDDQLAIPLADCRHRACVVDIAWRLPVAGWPVVGDGELAHPSWLVGDSFWLRAGDVMPRLGLDGDRVLRTPSERTRFGLPAQFALPAWRAGLADVAAAPSGDWRWRVEVEGRADAAAHGRQTGLLDFAALFAADARRTEADGVVLIHDASRDDDARAIAADLAAMRACVARRLGAAPAVAAVAQWPRGLPPGDGDAALAGTLLLLAEEPHWDVAERGTGRLARRADIAAALARRAVADAADLREGHGAAWLSAGLPGAVGLLCVAESDGVGALQALLSRGAQRTTEALASADVPVGPLALARQGDWAADYAPLAALPWASRLEPETLRALFAAVRGAGSVRGPLAEAFGADETALWLGPPNAVDLHARDGRPAGERWTWRDGGWQPVAAPPHPLALRVADGRLRRDAESAAAADALFLDDWPAYEREPKDNRRAAD